jgi:uncharacterized protein YdaU (DUF1376 family)
MAQAPVMPLFTDALIADTTHLNTKQFGAYVLILIATWRNNGKAFADNDRRLAQLCRMRVDTWRRFYRPVLVEFFNISDGFWHQKRLEKEWAKRRWFVEKPEKDISEHNRSHDTKNDSSHEPKNRSSLDPVSSENNKLQARGLTRARARSSHIHKNPSSSSLLSSARARGLSVGPDRARDEIATPVNGHPVELGSWKQAFAAVANLMPPDPERRRKRDTTA